MKRIATLLLAALLLAACQPDEPTPAPQPTPKPSLAGTAWVGTLADTYMGYPMTMTYNLDFLSDSAGALYIEILVSGQPVTPVDLSFHYTFDGDSGILEGDEWYTDFAYHADGPTIVTHLVLIDQNNTPLGGEVTLYPRGEAPEPPALDSFPANTDWSALQVLDSGDTVSWALSFWDYGAGGSLTIRLQNHSTSTYIGWQYTPATARGTLTLSGHTVPFTYDADTDVISCVLNGRLHFGDESVTVGGPLQFRRQTP